MKRIKIVENIKVKNTKDDNIFETLFIDENDNRVYLNPGEEFLYLQDNKVHKYGD